MPLLRCIATLFRQARLSVFTCNKHSVQKTLSLLLTILFITFAVTACTPSRTTRLESPSGKPEFATFNGDYEALPELHQAIPRSIAILPFLREGTTAPLSSEQAQQSLQQREISASSAKSSSSTSGPPLKIIRRSLYNHMASLPFTDIELPEVDRRLNSAGLHTPEQVTQALFSTPEKLKKILGVDAVILPVLTHYERVFAGIISQVAVGCELTLIDLNTGAPLWRAKHVARELAGGVSVTPIGLAMNAISSVWHLRESQLHSSTDDLFRDIALALEYSLPSSLQRRLPQQPRITLFTLLNKKTRFHTGDTLRFRLLGPPDSEVWLDLPALQENIPMHPLPEHEDHLARTRTLDALYKKLSHNNLTPLTRQQPPQEENYSDNSTASTLLPPASSLQMAVENALAERTIYEAEYVVTQGLEINRIMPKARLIAPNGGITDTFLPTILSIDGVSPSQPSLIKATALNNGVVLQWKNNPEPDTHSYSIEVATGTDTTYTRLPHQTGDTEIHLNGFENFIPIRARVIAHDLNGNESIPSLALRVIPTPSPELLSATQAPQHITGTVTTAMRMVRSHSPYTVNGTLSILENGFLFIEAGVDILFTPDGEILINKGKLEAAGTAAHPIQFLPENTYTAEAIPQTHSNTGRQTSSALAKTEETYPNTLRPRYNGSGAWSGITIKGGNTHLKHSFIYGAGTAIRIANASPSFQHVVISNSHLTGVHITSQSAPQFTCSRFVNNQGMGAILIEGTNHNARFFNNSFSNNTPFDAQNFSPLQLQLTNNYWKDGVPKTLGNVETIPALKAPPLCLQIDKPEKQASSTSPQLSQETAGNNHDQ